MFVIFNLVYWKDGELPKQMSFTIRNHATDTAIDLKKKGYKTYIARLING